VYRGEKPAVLLSVSHFRQGACWGGSAASTRSQPRTRYRRPGSSGTPTAEAYDQPPRRRPAPVGHGGIGPADELHFLRSGREAQRQPERCSNLQVRVCGWNVRFTNLRPEEQDLFIAKAEALR